MDPRESCIAVSPKVAVVVVVVMIVVVVVVVVVWVVCGGVW